MAHHKSAIKRIELSERQRERNRGYKTNLKSAIKSVVEADSKESAADSLKAAFGVIDKLAIKGIIPKNRAANKKSRLARFVNAMN